ncbi:hypothetical protein [Kribbella sp. NPDC049227]|uniref:hypothetical protein n=1 Tax=Kribbella sp. NPDC049227 TaxID=3364113 RepID=UPI0037178F05
MDSDRYAGHIEYTVDLVAADHAAREQAKFGAGGFEGLRLGSAVVDVPERIVGLRIIGVVDVGVPALIAAVNYAHS